MADPAPVSAVSFAPGGLLQVVRAGYGGALLTVPGPVIRLATARPAAPRARAVARALGARYLLQAALTTAAASMRPSLVGTRHVHVLGVTAHPTGRGPCSRPGTC